jgi:hypothetical protein
MNRRRPVPDPRAAPDVTDHNERLARLLAFVVVVVVVVRGGPYGGGDGDGGAGS